MGEEEGRSLRGSCFAGHRSQQPAASYITSLPPIIIIVVVIFITIFNNIVINIPMLLYLPVIFVIINKITFVDPIE